MFDAERSAYPAPADFKVMRPEYEEDEETGEVRAIIEIPPFTVEGRSETRPGARRAALYEAQKTYRNYHPSHRIESPFPDEFEDADGTKWTRVPQRDRRRLQADYAFLLDGEDEEDYTEIEQMLMWDIRPEPVYEDEDEDDE